MIYLDNAATTPMTPSVCQAMTQVMLENFGNPSSLHAYGRKASQLLRQSRMTIARLLDTTEKQIIFTSGGSESNNMAIKGYALANQVKGKHLITTAIEHHSVLDVMAYLEERFGFEVTYIQPQDGNISVEQVRGALREDTILVSIMAANNETGLQLPISEIGELLAKHQAVFHVDAVQAMGKIPVKPEEWHIDLLSATAHKFHGPKGVGFLYAKPLMMDKLIHGGSQENKRRASTENLPAIVGMAQALSEAYDHMEEQLNYVSNLKADFLQALDGMDYYLNESKANLPHIINIGFRGIDNNILLTQLDLAGYALSTGSACTAGLAQPSHVLASLYGNHSHRLKESIRISLSKLTQADDLPALADTLHKLIKKES